MLIIVNDGCGQMCNRLYNQVNAIATGLDKNVEIQYYGFMKFPSFSYRSKRIEKILRIRDKTFFKRVLFKTMSVMNIKSNHINKERFISILNQKTSQETILQLPDDEIKNRKYYIEGWPFVNLSALRKHCDEIRAYYLATSDMKEYVYGLLEKHKADGKIIVGVHIRRGDYINWRGGAYYFSDEVYVERMREFADTLSDKRVVYFVLSNETINHNPFNNDGYDVVYPNGTGEQDFHLLSSVDYIIGPPSSFSGMASFLGGIPRFIIQNAEEHISIEKMKIWLIETDNDGNPISDAEE